MIGALYFGQGYLGQSFPATGVAIVVDPVVPVDQPQVGGGGIYPRGSRAHGVSVIHYRHPSWIKKEQEDEAERLRLLAEQEAKQALEAKIETRTEQLKTIYAKAQAELSTHQAPPAKPVDVPTLQTMAAVDAAKALKEKHNDYALRLLLLAS